MNFDTLVIATADNHFFAGFPRPPSPKRDAAAWLPDQWPAARSAKPLGDGGDGQRSFDQYARHSSTPLGR
jgi:hypothetical protein